MRLQKNVLRARIKRSACLYWKCGAKTLTFIFWATLYMIVMKLTIFKSSATTPVREWSLEPDNYTKWMLQGPVLGDDETELVDVEWSQPDNDTIAELDMRTQTVHDVCRRRNISVHTINSQEFFVDHAHNLVWCNIFKAASSFWLYKFNILGGYDRKLLARSRHSPLMLARQKFPRPSVEELTDAINTPEVIALLVVREPFVRLLSAYRDKLENLTPPYYRKLARTIVNKYRARTTKLFGRVNSIGPTFYEFVRYLIDNHEANNKSFNEHWAPYYKFCSPCAVNFSVIAKVETLARDSAYVEHQLGLSHVFGMKLNSRRTRLRTVINKSKDGRNTSALLHHYFSQLDHRMLESLLAIYGIDFEMFGYDPKVYKKYVKK